MKENEAKLRKFNSFDKQTKTGLAVFEEMLKEAAVTAGSPRNHPHEKQRPCGTFRICAAEVTVSGNLMMETAGARA